MIHVHGMLKFYSSSLSETTACASHQWSYVSLLLNDASYLPQYWHLATLEAMVISRYKQFL